MWAASVVEAEIAADPGAGLGDAGVSSQVDLLVIDGPPLAYCPWTMYAASGMWSDKMRALMKSAGDRVPINGARSEALWCEPGVPLRCLAVPVLLPDVVPKARLRRDAPHRLCASPSLGLTVSGPAGPGPARLVSSVSGGGGPVAAATGNQRPDRSRHAVGRRDRDHLHGLADKHPVAPARCLTCRNRRRGHPRQPVKPQEPRCRPRPARHRRMVPLFGENAPPGPFLIPPTCRPTAPTSTPSKWRSQSSRR